MLSQEDNETLTRVGPGTLMGNLLRRYWLPALLSAELPENDGPPLRVRLLGEDLVAFRDTSGKTGLFVQACPHRGASLFFGRNEEDGLRCVYHGWKFDTSGACTDMPSEPAESNFKSKVRVTSYPTHESGGIVWTYMGPKDRQLPFRDFGSESLPPSQWRASKLLSYCNFIQAMEGNLDTAHISYLHRNFADRDVEADDTDRPGYPSVQMSTRIRANDRTPSVEVQDMPYGYRYAGLRQTPNGYTNARMSVFVLPVMTFVAALPVGGSCGMFVPIDDDNCWRYNFATHAATGSAGGGPTGGRPVPTAAGPRNGVAERLVLPENDYLIDREAQRTESYTGILGVVQQDLAVTESMGTVYDRTSEHLGSTDKAIIRMREQLIKAARDLANGIEPPALDPSFPWQDIRSAEKILAPGENWRRLATSDDETYVKLQAAVAR
jgi:nitrite reductase/ring-hydroxylating ferredoxin subunit